MGVTSDVPGFYRLTEEERITMLARFASMKREELPFPSPPRPLPLENSIGQFPLNLSLANYFLIDGKDYLIPMVTEEPSVVAAASNGAKIARAGGGFLTRTLGSTMRAQVVLRDAGSPPGEEEIRSLEEEVRQTVNQQMPMVVQAGGGYRGMSVEQVGRFLVFSLLIDPADSIGANALDRAAEAISPMLEQRYGGSALLRILSNRVHERFSQAEAQVPPDVVGGPEIAQAISDASSFAELNEDRAVTHNKGIMNGVEALALATGNDTRALEAAAHAFACREGRYRPLSTWTFDGKFLKGTLTLPTPIGTVGGSIAGNPAAKACLRVLGVKRASELGRIMAAVGLAQNLAALRALVSEGIQKGHMRLAARTLAATAGATGEEVNAVANRLLEEEGPLRVDRARQILEDLRKEQRKGNT